MDWEARINKIAEKVRENTEIRRRELEQLEAATQEIRELREERAATKFAVEKALVNDRETKKISEQAGKVFHILGFRVTQTGRKRVVLLGENEDQEVCVWETTQDEILRIRKWKHCGNT